MYSAVQGQYVDYNTDQGRRTAETGRSPVCRKWSTGTDEADRKGAGMKKKIIEFLQDMLAAASVFLFLWALYMLLSAVG